MKAKVLLIFIILLAVVLRFYKLGNNPPSLYWDEVSLGYNAWSVLSTGKDEHGDFLPVTNFKAFGDYKPPVYIYLTSASIKVFGANDFAVRFPSALFGVIAVFCTYLIVRKFFHVPALSLLAALFLSMSPWSVNLSRVAFEANVAWGLFLIALALFLYQRKFLSAVFFVLPLYTFNSSRVFIPLFLIILATFTYKKILAAKLKYFIFYFLILILTLPLIPHLMSKEGQLRFQEVNIFTNPVPVELSNARMNRDGHTIWTKIINNRRVYYGLDYLKHLTDNLKPDFLFLTGDVNGTFSTRRNGQLYLFDLPLIILGLYFLKTRAKKVFIFLIFWLVAGIFPAGVARETPHALRTLNLLPVYQIMAGVGLFFLTRDYKNQWLRFMFVLIIAGSFMFYLINYYVYYPKEEALNFQYGYKEVMEYVKNHKEKYHKIYVTGYYGRPYIYYLWYAQIPAQEFLAKADVVRSQFGFYTVYRFDNIYFDIPNVTEEPNNLLILSPYNLEKYPEIKTLQTINFPDGKTDFIIKEN